MKNLKVGHVVLGLLIATPVYHYYNVPLFTPSENQIPLGMFRADAMPLLAGSVREFDTFPWCDGLPTSCNEARKAGVVTFVSKKGLNGVFLVGFDAAGKVRYREALVHPWDK